MNTPSELYGFLQYMKAQEAISVLQLFLSLSELGGEREGVGGREGGREGEGGRGREAEGEEEGMEGEREREREGERERGREGEREGGREGREREGRTVFVTECLLSLQRN